MIGPVEELPSGVIVHQVTDSPRDKHNIYCEFPWCPPSSRCFVYVRHAPNHAPNPTEIVLCEFGSWRQRTIGYARGGLTMANGGKFYYSRIGDGGRRELVRVDLETELSEVLDLPEGVPDDARLDVGPGERLIAYNLTLSLKPQRFAIGLADRRTGKCELIHEDPYICNTHHQFEPGTGHTLMVQHNRGCRFTPDGKLDLLVGPEGATIFLLSVPDGKVTRLPVGPPYTHGISGHEAWIGTTGELLMTLNTSADYAHGKGPIVAVGANGPARAVCEPWHMNHVGLEPSGRVFCADTFAPDQIIIGSPFTHRSAVVCSARTSYLRASERNAWSDSHPHAYISPDCKWVVFNSDRTGTQQIYCASIPPAMLASILPPGSHT